MNKGCPSCGRIIAAENQKCPYCNYDFTDLSNIINKYENEKLNEIKISKYAGFIKRVVAGGIDLLIWFSIFTIITSIYTYYNKGIESILSIDGWIMTDISNQQKTTLLIIWLFMPICYLIYCTISQYSKKMATIGQRIVNIEVVTINDEPMSFSKSLIHNLAKILNIITIIGFLIIIFTPKKQSLSDIITKTLVINKQSDEKYNEYRYANPLVRLFAYIIDISYLSFIAFLYQFLATSPLIPEMKLKSFVLTILGIVTLIYILIYFPSMESKYGATFGKKILSIKVVKLNGEKQSFFQSLFRLIITSLESLIPFSRILSFVTPRKQTLKDILTKTIVINRG